MKYYISGYIFDVWAASYLQYRIDTEKPEELELYFDSNGGDPVAAGAIAEVVRNFEGKKTAYGIGFVQSAAVIPFLAVPVENRFLAKTADVLLHRLRTNAFSLTAEELAQASEEATKYEAELIDLHAKALGKTTAEMAAIMQAERHLTAAEAVEMGLAAGIIGDAAEPAKMAGMTLCATMAGKGGGEAGGSEAGGGEAGGSTVQSLMMLARHADPETIKQYASGKIDAAGFVLAVANRVGQQAAGSGGVPAVESEFFGGGKEEGGGNKRQEYINLYNSSPHIQALFHHGAEKYADFRESQEKNKTRRGDANE
jgi:ATP-dependent protease ClpP protease subunit